MSKKKEASAGTSVPNLHVEAPLASGGAEQDFAFQLPEDEPEEADPVFNILFTMRSVVYGDSVQPLRKLVAALCPKEQAEAIAYRSKMERLKQAGEAVAQAANEAVANVLSQ